MANEYILKAEGIKKSFGGIQALRGVNLEIKKGEIHCLAGENGSGKSTLIKIISGDYTADSGVITIGDESYQTITPAESISKGIQVIYQDFSIFPNLTVTENIAATHALMEKKKMVNWKQFRKIAQEAVARIGFSIDFDERVENLSVANKQLIAISRALLFDARLIIMDEPTTALTKKEVDALFAIIKKLQEEEISILFVSHKMDEVFEISERITILRNGENIITTNIKDIDDKKFTYYMTGREFGESRFTCESPGDTVIEVDKLGLADAYSDISFRVQKGEIYGITGLLGSGRSELALSLFGILVPDQGSIKIFDEVVNIKSVQVAQSFGIGYVPEDRTSEALFLQQSIENNMTISVIDQYTNSLGIYNVEKLKETSQHWKEELAIKLFRMTDPVSSLSGGNQQKTVLAKWLATEMNILVLNGPTVGVDIGSKYDLHMILRNLAARGIAIIMITDDLSELLPNCNRIMIMRDGRSICELNAHETTEQYVAEIIGGKQIQ